MQASFVQGTGAISQASDFLRSSPGIFPALSANLGPQSTVHSRNYTVWCYNDVDIQELTQVSEPAAEGDDAALPTWLPWLLTIGALLLTHAFSPYMRPSSHIPEVSIAHRYIVRSYGSVCTAAAMQKCMVVA